MYLVWAHLDPVAIAYYGNVIISKATLPLFNLVGGIY